MNLSELSVLLGMVSGVGLFLSLLILFSPRLEETTEILKDPDQSHRKDPCGLREMNRRLEQLRASDQYTSGKFPDNW